MLFREGEKVHVAERRGFESDTRRHFVGEVTDVDQNAIRIKGFVFIFDGSEEGFHRHSELRSRIVSLVDARLIINIIPSDTNLDAVRYKVNGDGVLMVTDGSSYTMAVSEFGARR